MTHLLEFGLTNAVLATLLAILVWLATRFWQHPALVHALWVVVLAKLITPPLIAVPWQFPQATLAIGDLNEFATRFSPRAATDTPTPDEEPAASPTSIVEQPNAIESRAVELPIVEAALPESHSAMPTVANSNSLPPESLYGISWIGATFAFWLLGSAVYLILATVRLVRFHRSLADTEPPTRNLQQWGEEAAGKIGFTRNYRLRVTDGRVSPLVWPVGRPTILLPRRLLEHLSEAQVRSLLAHELAHLQRRDHWVRWLELIVSTLYWWHPVVWWARREIQTAEEQACDAWVVSAFPDIARRYADALFQAVQFSAEGTSTVPAVASGITAGRALKERIENVLNKKWDCRQAERCRLVVFLCALSVLPLSVHAVLASGQPNSEAGGQELGADQGAEPERVPHSQPERPAEPSLLPPEEIGGADKELADGSDETIQAGARLRVLISSSRPGWEDTPKLDALITVDSNGDLSLGPHYGKFAIGGKTIGEADEMLEDSLKSLFADPDIQLEIVELPAAAAGESVGRAMLAEALEIKERLPPGTKLRIRVAGTPQDYPIDGDFQIELRGTVALGPAYGRANVSGMTISEAEKSVTEHLKQFLTDPQVQITLPSSASDVASSAPVSEAPPVSEELKVLQELVGILQRQFEDVDAKFQNGVAGGSVFRREEAAYELALAKGELALAKGDQKIATAHFKDALHHADVALEAVDALYRAGRISQDRMLEAAKRRAEIQRKLIQLQVGSRAVSTSSPHVAVDPSKSMALLALARQRPLSAQVASPLHLTESMRVLKKIAEHNKQDYERMKQAFEQSTVSARALAAAQREYEVSIERIRQAELGLRYYQKAAAVAQKEYELLIKANKAQKGAIAETELELAKLRAEQAKILVEAFGE